MSMTVVREICGAAPQDLVVRLDDTGQEINFYFRHGVARLFNVDDPEGFFPLIGRTYTGKADRMADGVLPLDEVEDLVRSMLQEVLA